MLEDEEEARAWAGHTTGAFSLGTYSGGHFYLMHHQARVLGAISERISRL